METRDINFARAARVAMSTEKMMIRRIGFLVLPVFRFI